MKRFLVPIAFAILMLGLLYCIPLPAQNASVVALDKADAQEAREKWDKLQKAQAEWDALQERIKKDYIYVSPGSKDAGSVFDDSSGEHAIRTGFSGSFDFSTDFKFIVPAQTKSQASAMFCNWTPTAISPSTAPIAISTQSGTTLGAGFTISKGAKQ